MTDKQTPLIVDALTFAAAETTGTPLYAGKGEPGLFPNTSAGRTAALKAIDAKWLKIISTETKGKATREICTVTESGLQYLLEQVSPKQVLEDFVRVLEQREGQVGELLELARRMADQLGGLKAALAMVLPQVQVKRLPAMRVEPVAIVRGGGGSMTILDAEPNEIGEAILARLQDWCSTAAVGQDCPLPELYRSLSTLAPSPRLGEFHDALRQLDGEGRIYLHPWTGPLYAMPEPTFALMCGHNVAYYASVR